MKTWWGLRHLRYFYYRWKVYSWAKVWSELGVGFGHPSAHDLAFLERIWKGLE